MELNEESPSLQSWEILKGIIDAKDRKRLTEYLDDLSSSDTARAISRLDQDSQNALLNLLDPGDAADLIEELPDAQAKDLIEDLTDVQAAAIVDELPSDQQADILQSLPPQDAEAILQEMDPEEAKDARQLLSYSPNTAGGLMVTEFLAYSDHFTINQIIEDLRKNAEKYSTYDVFYAYVIDSHKKLKGVVRVRDLILNQGHIQVENIMIKDPVFVNVRASLEELQDLMDRYNFFGIPVCDNQGRLVGVVRKTSVSEASVEEAEKSFLQASGILGGEELRASPMRERVTRRFTVLIIKIALNLVSASVIAAFYDTLSSVVALAVFLPIISDLGGSSGNQAVAVSIRELALGLIRPVDFLNVVFHETKLGMILGVGLGMILGLVAFFWKGNPYLGFVVGLGVASNTVISVLVGGVLPLALKRLKVDPALASSAVLTTVTDGFGFFFVLLLATFLLPQLSGL